MTVMGQLFTFYYIASLAPLVGGNVGFGFLVMAVMMISVTLVYYAFTVIMPRSGGDYVFVSRTLHPVLGLMGNMSYGVTLLLFAAITGVTMESTALTTLFGYLGTLYSNATLTNLASAVSTPTWTFILGLVWMIGGALLAVGPVRIYLKVQNLMFILVMIGALAIIFALLPVSQATFASSFNGFAAQYMGKPGDYYNIVINNATTSGWTLPSTSSYYGGLLIFPIVAVGGLGMWTYGAQIAGEVRNPRRSFLLGTLLADGIFLALNGITLILLYNATGFNFLSAIDYLLYNNPSAIPLPALPYADMLVAVVTVPAVAVLIMLTSFLQQFIYMPSAYLFMSRGFLAYSFDRVIPESFGKVSDRTHGPVNSVIASVIISIILFVVINVPASAQYAYLLSSVTTWWEAIFPTFFVGVAALVLYKRKPSLYQAMPIKGWKLVGVGLSTIFFTLLLTYLMLVTDVYGANTPMAIELVVAILIVFIFVYLIARLRKGSMLQLAFKEIPPE
jgi:amino acid transporter